MTCQFGDEAHCSESETSEDGNQVKSNPNPDFLPIRNKEATWDKRLASAASQPEQVELSPKHIPHSVTSILQSA